MTGDSPALIVTTDTAGELLESLVAVPSPSGHEHDAAALLVRWMGERGFDAGIDEVGNAVGSRGSGPHEILLLGHIDTFPGVVPVRREGSLLYGRGAVDAKGPLCAFAVAAASLAVPEAWRVTVVGAVEEEAASSRGAHHVLAKRKGGHAPRYCIIGEPSRWNRMTLGYKGCLRGEIRLRHPFAHSAGQARLPAEAGVDLWHAVERWCATRNRDRPEREFDRIRASLVAIETADAGTSGIVTLHIVFRLSPADDPAETARALGEALDECVRDAPAGITIAHVFSGGLAAHRARKSTSLVREFLQAIRGRGGDARFVNKTGTSDMNVVAPHWPDTAVVAYGPGDSALDHTPDEHIDLAEYASAIAVLSAALASLLAVQRPA
ncbi:MAG TPA: [LysW]-lysine hydrolase [Gemmatimonadales bacterium]